MAQWEKAPDFNFTDIIESPTVYPSACWREESGSPLGEDGRTFA